MVEPTLVVEQTEQERPDERPGPVLVPAEPGNDAVGGPLMLDLEHRPLARLIGGVQPLGDHPVESGPFEPIEPIGRQASVAGRRRQVDPGRVRPEQPFETRPTLGLGHCAQVLVAERQQVPRDEAGG